MNCHEFQAQLAELIGSGQKPGDHPHLKICPLCRALLADLETIAEAARQLFPIQQPKEELWERIESAIKDEEASS
jgi:hypothetical protein